MKIPKILPSQMDAETNLANLEKKVGFVFKNKDLLKNAFIHRSYLNEHKDFKGDSNERLEFLGDSVLSIVVSRFLFVKLPESTEGNLTTLRAALVRTETLAKVAVKLSLGTYLFLSKGEEDSKGRNNSSTMANTFEALLGAIYLDSGLESAEAFIQKTILSNWKQLAESATQDNKSKLQEFLQRQNHKSPNYKQITAWGPDHAKKFEIGVFLDEKILGAGRGKNKQEAAQNAAGDALSKLATSEKLENVAKV